MELAVTSSSHALHALVSALCVHVYSSLEEPGEVQITVRLSQIRPLRLMEV